MFKISNTVWRINLAFSKQKFLHAHFYSRKGIVLRSYLSYNMPKNKKDTESRKNIPEKSNSSKHESIEPVYMANNGEIVIKIHAKPGAKESCVTDVSSDAVGIQIGAPPVDGEANKELIRFLAKILKLRKSDLSLDKGSRSKEKTVTVANAISVDEVINLLKCASKQ